MRGPPSPLYGAGKVGGLVNFLPKTAGAGPFGEARPTGAALAASRRAASSSMLYADDSMAGDPYKAPETTLAPAWVRGCKCQVSEGRESD